MGGTINPGIALAVNPPAQAPGALDMAKSGMSLQALINQTKLQQQEQAQNAIKQQSDQIALQQQQQDQEDNQKLRQAFTEAGGDWDKTMSGAQAAGVNPQKIFQLQGQHVDQLTKMSQLDKSLLDNETAKHDAVARDAQQVLAADPADRQALWTKLSNQHYLNGTYKPGEIPPTVPDEAGLTDILHSSKSMLADLNAAADLKKKQEEDPTVQAEQSAKRIQTGAGMLVNASDEPTHQLILGSLKKQGLTSDEIGQLPQHYSPDNKQALQTMSLSPEEQAKLAGTGAGQDSRYRNIVQAQKLGQPVPPADVAWKAAYEKQKELNTTTRFNLQNNGIPAFGAGGGAGGGGGTGAPGAGGAGGAGGATPQKTIAQVNPSIRGRVQAILDYRQALPPAGRANPVNSAISEAVYALDPDHDETTYPNRVKLVQKYSTSAGEGQIGAINTALGHLGELDNARQAAASSNIPLLNSLAAKVGATVGATPATTYTAILHRVGPEMTSAYVKGGGGEGERGANEADFDLSKGDAQLKDNIAYSAKLLNSKIDSERNNWQNEFHPKKDADQFDNRFITPAARDVLNRLAPAAGGGAAGGGAKQGFTRVKASDGKMHDIPTANLDAAKKIDPGLQVQQ